jgi:hypothetical protein
MKMTTDTNALRVRQTGASRVRDDAQWVGMTEATQLADKSEATIRRLIERKLVEARKDQNGRYQIVRLSLMGYLASSSSPASTKASRSGVTSARTLSKASPFVTASSDEGVIVALREQIANFKDQLNREQRLNDELRVQVKDLEREKTQHLAEMRAMLSSSESKAQSVSQWVRSKLKG